MEKTAMQDLGRVSVADFKRQKKIPLIVVLDNVRSGLNIGSVFRTADAFAIEKVILCGITAQPPHREILKTALGSTESVDWEYAPQTIEAVQTLKAAGAKVYAVEQTTEKIWLQDFTPLPGARYALVFGNEVDGVDLDVIRQCDGVIEIPQFGAKHSLNIAVSAGIVIWDLTQKIRQNI